MVEFTGLAARLLRRARVSRYPIHAEAMRPLPILACALFLALAATAARAADPDGKDALIRELIDRIYTMEFDRAEQVGRRLAAVDPASPFGAFGLTAVAMTRFVYETEQADLSLLPVFERNAEESIERATEWCRSHPDDAEGLMVLGASYGIAARISALRHNWITAYLQGRKAIRYTRASAHLDPSLGDPWLGIGMYDYYSDTYPRFVGALAKLLLRGDRRRGIAGLRRAAQTGRYVNTAAKLLLVEVYTEDRYGERDPEEAVRIMADVRSTYPESLMLQAAELFALYESRRYDATLAGCDEFLGKAAQLPIAPIQTAKGRHIQGTTLWAMGRRKEAEGALREGAESLLAGGPTMWGVWSRIRLARLLDLEGRRQEAQEQYRLAAALPDHWSLREVAKAGLSKPWTDPYPGHLSPF